MDSSGSDADGDCDCDRRVSYYSEKEVQSVLMNFHLMTHSINNVVFDQFIYPEVLHMYIYKVFVLFLTEINEHVTEVNRDGASDAVSLS